MVKRTLSLAVAFGLFVSAPVSAKVLAEVNGKKITDKDLNRVIDSLPPQYRTLKNNPQFRKQMLNNMVKEEVLYQEALKEGVDKNPQVRQEIEAMKRRIIVQYLLRKHVKPPKVKVTEREAKEFYEKNRKMFTDANGKQVPFSAVKPFIIQSLQQQKERQAVEKAVNDYVKSLEAKAKVKFYSK
jgi:peptidyl-prolyl cis-trans isomerase C